MQLDTIVKQHESIRPKANSLNVKHATEVSEANDEQPIDMVIASLVDQLKRENDNIAQLMERQRELRVELLKAQEQSLAALRRTNDK